MKKFQKGETVIVRGHKMKVVNHNAPLVYLVELTDKQCEVGTSVEYDSDVLPISVDIRIRQAIEVSCRELKEQQQRIQNLLVDWNGANIGDLFLLPDAESVSTPFWLVVRVHPDDESTVLVVAVTDGFMGECDVRYGESVYIGHCNHSYWVDRTALKPEYLCDGDNRELFNLMSLVRKRLHQMATGQNWTIQPTQTMIEDSEEYEEQMRDVANAGNRLWDKGQ